MFVQSLSWQKDRFYIKMAQKDRFYSPQLLGAPLLQDRHTLFLALSLRLSRACLGKNDGIL